MLDTNICICIYLIKHQVSRVLHRFEALHQGEAVMSVVTLADLRAGLEMQTANRIRDEQVLSLLIRGIPMLSFDEAAAASYGVLRAVRERNRDTLDRLIAAHAVSAGATLVTNNAVDFRDYPGLAVENWGRPAQLP